ncbi:hypothetical protein ACOSP7_013194 [Xanthoceras sorbifolium]
MEPEEIARRWAKLSFSDDDGPIAIIDEGLKAEGIRRLSLSLVGKIVSNREVNKEAFRNTIASIWRTKSEVEVESIGINLFVFRFGCFWDRKRVLEGSPCLVPFWVQIYDLPLVCMNRDMGLFLGGLIGVVQEIDGGDSGDCLGKFLRVRVLINVQQPLKRGLGFAFGAGREISKVTPEAVETAPASMSSNPTLSENSGSLVENFCSIEVGEIVNAEISSPTKKWWKRLARVRFKELVDEDMVMAGDKRGLEGDNVDGHHSKKSRGGSGVLETAAEAEDQLRCQK